MKWRYRSVMNNLRTAGRAVFVGLRPEVIAIIDKPREQGHHAWWCYPIPTDCIPTSGRREYPEVRAAADHIYLSQDLGM